MGFALPGFRQRVIQVRQVQEFTDFPADVQEAAAGFSEMQMPAERPQGS